MRIQLVHAVLRTIDNTDHGTAWMSAWWHGYMGTPYGKGKKEKDSLSQDFLIRTQSACGCAGERGFLFFPLQPTIFTTNNDE